MNHSVQRHGTGILIGVVLGGFILCAPRIASAQSPWGDNLITNPSFDDGDDWPTGWTKRSAIRTGGVRSLVEMKLDSVEYRSGKKSLRISGSSSTTAWYSAESAPVPVEPGRRYYLMGWIKTDDVNPIGNQYHNCNLHARFTDAGGGRVLISGGRVSVTKTVGGTTVWQRFEKVVTAPVGAELMQVGCVLTCAGTVWFDDIALYEQRDLDWKKLETDRFVFLYEAADAPPTKTEVQEAEKHLARVEEALGLKHEGKVRYYKYETRERKREITGIEKTVHYDDEGIHGTKWNDKHEMVHVVMAPMGRSNMLLQEGIAVYFEWKWREMDLHEYTREQSKEFTLPKITELASDSEFASIGKDLTLSASGSFVGYLIEEYGMDKFKTLYGIMNPHVAVDDFQKRFLRIYDRDLTDIEAMWRAKISPRH